jgi:hypothetical protein
LPDLIEEAIGIYDGFMLDDDYDSQRCLDRLVAKLKEGRDFYDQPATKATPDRAPAPADAALVEQEERDRAIAWLCWTWRRSGLWKASNTLMVAKMNAMTF